MKIKIKTETDTDTKKKGILFFWFSISLGVAVMLFIASYKHGLNIVTTTPPVDMTEVFTAFVIDFLFGILSTMCAINYFWRFMK